MVDAYVIIRTWNRLTEPARLVGLTEMDPESNNVGDVIEIRRANMDPWSTPYERTKFYFFKLTDIPVAVAVKVQERLIGDLGTWRRNFSLNPGDVRPVKVVNWLKKEFPSHSANFAAYFNGTTEQPVSEVLSISWPNFRARIWNKVAARVATQAELET